MPRSLPVPYAPNPVPSNMEDIPRYLYDELTRIKDSFVAQPVALAIEKTGDFLTTTVINWVQEFIGDTPTWDVPGGGFDAATGVWTCPQSGLYAIDIQLNVDPFGAGNKNYYAGIRLFRDRDGVVEYRESTDGGVDNIPLGVSLSGLVNLLQGDKLAVDMAVVHESWVGTAPYKIGWQILRQSG